MTTVLRHRKKLSHDARDKAEKMVGRAIMSGYRVTPVGSRCIPFAADRNSDWDFLVEGSNITWELQKNGFSKDSGSEVPDSQFTSMSYLGKNRQRVNFICAHSSEFYDEFLSAQILCNAYKVKDKGDRIHVFETIRNGGLLDMDKLPSSYNVSF